MPDDQDHTPPETQLPAKPREACVTDQAVVELGDSPTTSSAESGTTGEPRQRTYADVSLVEISESDDLPMLTKDETHDLLAWRGRVEGLLAEDPIAYAKACRSGVQL